MFYYHLGLMGTSFMVLFTGGFIARYGKRQRWWLRAHRGLACTGVILAMAGFAAMFLGKEGGHFRTPHAWLGAVVLLMVFVTPVLGNLSFVMKGKAANLRTIHRWSGRATLTLMAVNLLSGLFLAGIL